MPAEYAVEIYSPNRQDLWVSFTSSSPFMAISVGDVINPAAWKDSGGRARSKVRVVGVEHVLSENGDLHAIRVSTATT